LRFCCPLLLLFRFLGSSLGTLLGLLFCLAALFLLAFLALLGELGAVLLDAFLQVAEKLVELAAFLLSAVPYRFLGQRRVVRVEHRGLGRIYRSEDSGLGDVIRAEDSGLGCIIRFLGVEAHRGVGLAWGVAEVDGGLVGGGVPEVDGGLVCGGVPEVDSGLVRAVTRRRVRGEVGGGVVVRGGGGRGVEAHGGVNG